MHHMIRWISLVVMVVAISVGLASAQIVEPGESLDLKSVAPVSPCDIEVLLDPNAPVGASANAACDEVTGFAKAEVRLEGIVNTTIGGTASAFLDYVFQVSSTAETADNPVGAILSYGIDWRGLKQASINGQSTVAIDLSVLDVTDPMNELVVAQIDLHEDGIGRGQCTAPECLNLPLQDSDGRVNTLPLALLRGHSYRVTLALHTAADVLSDAGGADATSDYMDALIGSTDVGGVFLNNLNLSVNPDLVELAAQVAANTEAIEDLQEALAELAEAFANHSHTYLTGRGFGHNNTVAETGSPVDPEAELPEDPRPGRRRGQR